MKGKENVSISLAKTNKIVNANDIKQIISSMA